MVRYSQQCVTVPEMLDDTDTDTGSDTTKENEQFPVPVSNTLTLR